MKTNGRPPSAANPGRFAPAMRTRALAVSPAVLAFLSLWVGPAFAVSAQVPAPPPPAGANAVDDSTAALFQEYQSTLQQLGQLQVQALQTDASLDEHRSSIDTLIIATMAQVDPGTHANIERLDSLAAEARAAQQARNNAAVDALMGPMMTLRGELEAAQSEALQQPQVQSAIQGFEDAMLAAIVAIDPGAAALQARLDELEEALSTVLPPSP
jgi:hypothetical protein